MLTILERLERINGGRMELWLNMREISHGIVEKFKLRPLAEEVIATHTYPLAGQIAEPAEMPQMKAMPAEAIRKIPRIDPRGGMRLPHLHLDGKIFMLEGEVYREFSKQIIGNIQKRVSAAGTIPFNQLLEVSEASIGL